MAADTRLSYPLLPRGGADHDALRDSFDNDFDSDDGDFGLPTRAPPPWWRKPLDHLSSQTHRYSPLDRTPTPKGNLMRVLWWICISMAAIPAFMLFLVLVTFAFFPSYTSPPKHYGELRRRVERSSEPGRANLRNEKVFIVSALYDQGGELLGGEWGRNLLNLIDLVGPKNVFLSIYENDPDPGALAAMEKLRAIVPCEVSIVSEHLDHEPLPRITLPDGETRLKRVAFLAEVRNRALAPLLMPSLAATSFDKLLYLNDVFFDPIDAAQLLFSTNLNPKTGRTDFGAACAVDFINAFKFYDRFATRDLEGEAMGIPFYPWFAVSGRSESRNDVLSQRDAVRLRSCWGGMTAFEGRWFQNNVTSHDRPFLSFTNNTPHAVPGGIGLNPDGALRFRYEADSFWDASECCLIHADLQYARSGRDIKEDSGIYMNPYVRVAYDPDTLGWLPWTRRTERLYSGVHHLLNRYVGFPWPNPRIGEEPGDKVRERVWAGVDGKYEDIERVAPPGRFCGARGALVLNEDGHGGHKGWMSIPAPPDAT